MSDESKAAIAVSLWIAFNGGILLAAEHKAVGFMIAISATLIFLVYLAGDIRLEAEKKRRKRYQQDCARREQEVRKWRE
ncbi:hypothetical protein [uncultured Ruminococcus sp.]|uniref:hypothetical protein n=1 Tax=uncultured Ruminococcus sp. TaxID=165186 RepID=UPI000EE28999|nr:hypothetical protein [uncultured Ruminococcus sp.]HCJ40581.1 hypothetical protein [Ruminococcus sp.]